MAYIKKEPNCGNNWLNNMTNLKNDCCETSWKDTTNSIFSNYAFGYNSRCNTKTDYLCQPGLNQQYPSVVCGNIENDSFLRNGYEGNIITHTKSKKQLDCRPYRSVPHMGECMSPLLDTDTYSRLLHGENTRNLKSCGTQAHLDRWEPQVPCIRNNIQNPDHYIPKYWVRGGMSTSSYYRNIDYLKACGLKNCRDTCQELFCPDIQVPERIRRQKMQQMNLPCFPGQIPLKRRF